MEDDDTRVDTYLWLHYSEERVVLRRILLIGAIVGIVVAHGFVLYKIDTGVRSAEAKQENESGTRRAAYW